MKNVKRSFRMNKKLMTTFVLSAFLGKSELSQAAPSAPAPLYSVTVVQDAAKAINYRNLKGAVEIEFKGTVLLPAALGVATIKNRAGVTEIDSSFKNLTAPTQFGSEYLTYILWAISPDGRATNLGELIVNDGES